MHLLKINIKSRIRLNRFMTNVPMEMESFEKTAAGDGGWWRCMFFTLVVLNKHKQL